MLRVVIWLGQFLFVAPALYSSFISLWGLRTPTPNPVVAPKVRIRAVVAAHNEEAVVAGIAQDLAAQIYPQGLLRVCVVADRCSDETMAVARKFVNVAERVEGDGAKGAAIAWYLAEAPLEPGEALLVLDADNRVGPDYVGQVAGALEAGADAVQTYLDVANPDGSPLATASALTYWASNRMVQLARSNLGWSCDLGGTGMAVTGEALAASGGFADELTDDLSLNIRLNLAGYRTNWLHTAKVFDEKPTGSASAVVQRSRWVRGKRAVQRQYGWRLVQRGLSGRQPPLLDLAFRLYNPGRSFIALLIALMAVASAVFPQWGLWPWWVHAVVATVVVLLPLVFLAVDRVPARYLMKYPYVTLIAVLWLPIRIGSRFMSGWKRTPHRG